jgi:hypothetical protein
MRQKTFVLIFPDTFSISPSIAEIMDDFPEPTLPTTASKPPFFTVRLIFFRTGVSSGFHVKVPFSTTIGLAERKMLILFHQIRKDHIKTLTPTPQGLYEISI